MLIEHCTQLIPSVTSVHHYTPTVHTSTLCLVILDGEDFVAVPRLIDWNRSQWVLLMHRVLPCLYIHVWDTDGLLNILKLAYSGLWSSVLSIYFKKTCFHVKPSLSYLMQGCERDESPLQQPILSLHRCQGSCVILRLHSTCGYICCFY